MNGRRVDMHTHSSHSFDGNHSCFMLCDSAISMGAEALAITDHCDIDGKDLDIDAFCRAQISEIEECKQRYKGKLDVLTGIEIGQSIYRREQTVKLLSEYDYDFVLGSLHNLEDREDFYFLDYSKLDVKGVLNDYFGDLLKVVDFGCFDSLAHLTYPMRYISDAGIAVDLAEFSSVIDEILSLLAEKEKALEINTSGLFLSMKNTLPDVSIVKRFKELGGKYITLGSDSHYAQKLYKGIEQGADVAKSAGFEYVTVYRNREPELAKI